MTKNEFLNKLSLELKKHDIDDCDDIVTYYEDIIDGKIEKGISESEALKSYQDIDSIIKEIILENTGNKPFTYSDFVQESPNKNGPNGSLVIPIKKNGIYTNQTIINDKSNISVNVWDRKINITSSNTNDKLLVNYHKRFFSPVEVRIDDNDVKILEKTNQLWLSFLFRTIVFVIIWLVSFYLLESFVTKIVWWHYLVIFGISSTIVNLSFLFFWLLTRKNKDIEIIAPRSFKLHSLNTIVKSGNVYIDKVIAKTMSLKVVSGKVRLNDSHADVLEIKVSSGSAIIGDDGYIFPSKINRLNLITSSGSIRIYGINANNFTSKTSSGSLKLYDSKFDIVNIKCSSGSVKGDNLSLLDSNIIVRSGSVKLNNLVLGTSNLKASSGSIRFNDIKDSEQNFMFSGKATSGTIRINHKKMDFLGYKLVQEMPKKSITARVTSGIINLNFSNDK